MPLIIIFWILAFMAMGGMVLWMEAGRRIQLCLMLRRIERVELAGRIRRYRAGKECGPRIWVFRIRFRSGRVREIRAEEDSFLGRRLLRLEQEDRLEEGPGLRMLYGEI